MAAWMPTLAACSSVIILGYGGSLVLSGEIIVGTFTAFFMYVGMVLQPFRMAGFVVNLFTARGRRHRSSVRSARSCAGDRRCADRQDRRSASAAQSSSGI